MAGWDVDSDGWLGSLAGVAGRGALLGWLAGMAAGDCTSDGVLVSPS